VKGKAEILPISAVLYGAEPEMLQDHQALLADFYAGRLLAGDPRMAKLSAALPALGGYYQTLSQRLLHAGQESLPAKVLMG
jgi:hypothetical protein